MKAGDKVKVTGTSISGVVLRVFKNGQVLVSFKKGRGQFQENKFARREVEPA